MEVMSSQASVSGPVPSPRVFSPGAMRGLGHIFLTTAVCLCPLSFPCYPISSELPNISCPPPQLSLQVSLCLLFGRLSGMKSLPQLGTSGRGLVGCAVPGQG